MAPAPAAGICPLCHSLTCRNHPALPEQRLQRGQAVFVPKQSLEIAELT